jgi:hypothetical protein
LDVNNQLGDAGSDSGGKIAPPMTLSVGFQHSEAFRRK